MLLRHRLWRRFLGLCCAIQLAGCATVIGTFDPAQRAIMTAAAAGDTERVKQLVAERTDLNFAIGGLSPLGAAIIGGHLASARALLEGGASVDLELENGNRALAIAARRGDVDALKLLLAFKADPTASNDAGETALQLAAWDGYTAAVQCLVDGGAEPNNRDGSNTTPLHAAASRGHSETVKALIRAGADVNAAGLNTGVTPLMMAAGGAHLLTVRALIDAGADVNQEAGGVTALRIAAAMGDTTILKDLLAAGARLNDRDLRGRTALTLARLGKHTQAVAILQAAGATD
jgi:ankyrin repeat protein